MLSFISSLLYLGRKILNYRKIPKISPSMYKPLQIQVPQTGKTQKPYIKSPLQI